MDNSWFNSVRNNFDLKVVLIGFIFGFVLESILVIAYPMYIGLLGALIIFYCGLMAGLIGGGKTEEGIVNGAICSFGVPLVVLISYLFKIPSYLSFISLIEYIISIIFIAICVGVVGGFSGLIGSFIKRNLLSGIDYNKNIEIKKNLEFKAVLIGLIFGVIISFVHVISGLYIILGSGIIVGYIVNQKNNNAIINGFVCGFCIQLVGIIITIMTYLLRLYTNPSLHITYSTIFGSIILYLIYLTTFGLIYGLIGGIGGYIGSLIKKSNQKKNDENFGFDSNLENNLKTFSKEDHRYLVCEKCGGYYELQEGESPEDFEQCQCGGNLKYIQNRENKDPTFNQELTYEEEIDNLTKGYTEEKNNSSPFRLLNKMVFMFFLGWLIIFVIVYAILFLMIPRN